MSGPWVRGALPAPDEGAIRRRLEAILSWREFRPRQGGTLGALLRRDIAAFRDIAVSAGIEPR